MKRTRRYIFNTLTVVGLLLVLATVGLWVRSGMYQERYTSAPTIYETFRIENVFGQIHLLSFEIDKHTPLREMDGPRAKAGWESFELIEYDSYVDDVHRVIRR